MFNVEYLCRLRSSNLLAGGRSLLFRINRVRPCCNLFRSQSIEYCHQSDLRQLTFTEYNINIKYLFDITMSVENVQIIFDDPTAVFTPGQTISGRVSIVISNSSLNIKCKWFMR